MSRTGQTTVARHAGRARSTGKKEDQLSPVRGKRPTLQHTTLESPTSEMPFRYLPPSHLLTYDSDLVR